MHRTLTYFALATAFTILAGCSENAAESEATASDEVVTRDEVRFATSVGDKRLCLVIDQWAPQHISPSLGFQARLKLTEDGCAPGNPGGLFDLAHDGVVEVKHVPGAGERPIVGGRPARLFIETLGSVPSYAVPGHAFAKNANLAWETGYAVAEQRAFSVNAVRQPDGEFRLEGEGLCLGRARAGDENEVEFRAPAEGCRSFRRESERSGPLTNAIDSYNASAGDLCASILWAPTAAETRECGAQIAGVVQGVLDAWSDGRGPSPQGSLAANAAYDATSPCFGTYLRAVSETPDAPRAAHAEALARCAESVVSDRAFDVARRFPISNDMARLEDAQDAYRRALTKTHAAAKSVCEGLTGARPNGPEAAQTLAAFCRVDAAYLLDEYVAKGIDESAL